MCGIIGVLNNKIKNKEKVIESMASAIFHRGPDDDGFFVDNFVGLGMRRLSIIDLSTGRQPIASENEKLLIFFNGEIYNYKELRREIENEFAWKTNTDTEVILHMYEKYGEKMLTKLRGMFVFCIYNTETKEIFLARDFFGIKPLYYLVSEIAEDRLLQKGKGKNKNLSVTDSAEGGLLQNPRIVAFSSEIKSFFSYPNFKAEVNDEAVYNYLSFQYNPLPETFFKNVYKLPPAHFMKINVESGEVFVKKYWSFEFHPGVPSHIPDAQMEKEISEVTFETIKDSVKHHMIADVPVGSFLSGGVDSSIIATMMSSFMNDPENKVKTFTVGFDKLTEGEESKQTSDFLNTNHTEITVDAEEYFNELPKAVWHFDEPVGDPSAIGLYFVAREARKHVKVVLSGEGADELFGGYNIYLAPLAYRKISWIPKFLLGFLLKIPFDFYGKNFIYRAYEKIENWYIGNASVFKKKEFDLLWKGNNQKTLSLKPLYDKVKKLSDSTKMQYIDIHTWLIGDILAKADKMTMAHSLELRVPFLDLEVAKLSSVIPEALKWRNGATKYILREAFKNAIPESTRNRKKLGFPTPVKDWFDATKLDLYDKILENRYIKNHMNTDYIQRLIADHIARKSDNSRKIYLLLILTLWYDKFID